MAQQMFHPIVTLFYAFIYPLFREWYDAPLPSVDNGLLIPLNAGQLVGTFVENSGLVREYLGIPYASAKRWRPPTSPPQYNGTFEALAYSDSCPQQLTPSNVGFVKLAWTGKRDDELFVSESEDCLTANIWAPSLDRKQATAVLIWIHGGGFTYGASNLAIYNGSSMVHDNDDITVVSINYRLNIFGQPNAPQLKDSGEGFNFGLMDIRAAVLWVYDNIANFGGDPERITLCGQSAGAIAIEAYAFAYPNDHIVKGLIEQSGTSGVLPNNIVTAATPNATLWNQIAEAVGCGISPNSAQLSCMETIPSQTLEKAIIDLNAAFLVSGDGVTFPKDGLTLGQDGRFLKVPLLVGSTQHEFDPLLISGELLSPGFVVPGVTSAASDVLTLAVFICPENITATLRVNTKTPVFRYQYQATTTNFFRRQDLRAFHGSEIPMIFGTYKHITSTPSTTEIELSSTLQKAWVSFVRDPSRGLSYLGWPAYDPREPTYVMIGNANNLTGITLASIAPYDKACGDQAGLGQAIAQLSGLLA